MRKDTTDIEFVMWNIIKYYWGHRSLRRALNEFYKGLKS